MIFICSLTGVSSTAHSPDLACGAALPSSSGHQKSGRHGQGGMSYHRIQGPWVLMDTVVSGRRSLIQPHFLSGHFIYLHWHGHAASSTDPASNPFWRSFHCHWHVLWVRARAVYPMPELELLPWHKADDGSRSSGSSMGACGQSQNLHHYMPGARATTATACPRLDPAQDMRLVWHFCSIIWIMLACLCLATNLFTSKYLTRMLAISSSYF